MVTLSNISDEHTSTKRWGVLYSRHYRSFYVFVSDVPFTSTDLATTIAQSGVWSQHYTSYPNPNTLVTVGRSGRYVRIQLGDTNYLSLAEVKVFACNSTEGISTCGNPFLFTGREYDYETGLYYYRARYYNPEIGRFLQTDPVGYDAGMNLYGYCSNNPLNYSDPTGLSAECFDPCDPCDISNFWYGVGNLISSFLDPCDPCNLYTLWDFINNYIHPSDTTDWEQIVSCMPLEFEEGFKWGRLPIYCE